MVKTSKSDSDTSKSPGAATIVTHGCLLKGELTLTGPLHINGAVEGHINTNSQVLIGAKGRVEGTINAQHVVIGGYFYGTINAQLVELLGGSMFEGVLRATDCACEMGGKMNGDIQIMREH